MSDEAAVISDVSKVEAALPEKAAGGEVTPETADIPAEEPVEPAPAAVENSTQETNGNAAVEKPKTENEKEEKSAEEPKQEKEDKTESNAAEEKADVAETADASAEPEVPEAAKPVSPAASAETAKVDNNEEKEEDTAEEAKSEAPAKEDSTTVDSKNDSNDDDEEGKMEIDEESEPVVAPVARGVSARGRGRGRGRGRPPSGVPKAAPTPSLKEKADRKPRGKAVVDAVDSIASTRPRRSTTTRVDYANNDTSTVLAEVDDEIPGKLFKGKKNPKGKPVKGYVSDSDGAPSDDDDVEFGKKRKPGMTRGVVKGKRGRPSRAAVAKRNLKEYSDEDDDEVEYDDTNSDEEVSSSKKRKTDGPVPPRKKHEEEIEEEE